MTQTVKHSVMNGGENTPLCYWLREEVANLQLLHHRGLEAYRLQMSFGVTSHKDVSIKEVIDSPWQPAR